MACVTCGGWPDLADAPSCCTPPEGWDIESPESLALWEGAKYLILRLTGDCWQVCTHTATICRPCGCPIECSPCGCCFTRVQVPWLCGVITDVESEGVVLDPADWNLVNGLVWPTSCSWPCTVTLTVEVGDPPPDALVLAAKQLWCRLARECDPGTCALPEGAVSVTGPDGVTVQFRTFDEWLARNLTGIKLVDTLIAAYPCPKQPQQRLIDPADWARSTFQ